MHIEKTITHDGTEFVVCGTKDVTLVDWVCDGCGNTCNGLITILRERAQDEITFWCVDCVQIAKDGR